MTLATWLNISNSVRNRIILWVGALASFLTILSFSTGLASLQPFYNSVARYFQVSADYDKPEDAYRRFYELLREGDWRATYDLLDKESRVRMEYETKAALMPLAPDEVSREKIIQLEGIDLWEVILRCSEVNEREILDCKVDKNIAEIKVRIFVSGKKFTKIVNMIKEDGEWKLSWPKEDMRVKLE